jgi:hypothetical protein
MRLDLPKLLGADLADGQAVGETTLEQVVEQRQFLVLGSDDNLAADVVFDSVLLPSIANRAL